LTYENLLQEAADENIYVIEDAPFQSRADGLIRNDVIGINRTVRRSTQRACVLAEELGHYHTTIGDIINQSSDANRKQELRARLWSYNKLIGLHGIISCYKAGCQTAYDMSEHLGVTEDFLQEALHCYRSKYGIYTRFDNYVIFFEPTLSVLELI
jgi:hypothetical protein